MALRTNGSLRVLAAIREPDERVAVLLEAPLVPANIRHFRMDAEGVNVRTYSRPDEGLFRIAILQIEELRNVFEVLAEDIIVTACDRRPQLKRAFRLHYVWRLGRLSYEFGNADCQHQSNSD